MANWAEVLAEVQKLGSPFDQARRKYICNLNDLTGRNVIAYYSGWLQKPNVSQYLGIDDDDKNGLMACINKLETSRGLDLILHTPGGDMAATESIVDYLRKKFDGDLRAIIPQLAMSGGTMIALACRQIVMGKPSSIGPIDPQIGGIPAHGVLEEFTQAISDIQQNPATIPIWQAILSKYPPAFIGECRKAVQLAETLSKQWLETGMFAARKDPSGDAAKVVQELASHAVTLSHARHYSIDQAQALGLEILELESDQDLQDAVLSVHHSYILTLSQTPAAKIIENQKEVAYIKTAGP